MSTSARTWRWLPLALATAGCAPTGQAAQSITPPAPTQEAVASHGPQLVPPPAAPPSAEDERDARLRAAAEPRDVERHVAWLRAAAPSELDASCLAGGLPFAQRVEAFRGAGSTRTAACEGERCLLRLEHVGELSVHGLHVYYTRAEDGSVHAIRCDTLRGG